MVVGGMGDGGRENEGWREKIMDGWEKEREGWNIEMSKKLSAMTKTLTTAKM